ncbi:MAG: adenosine deaminase family protein, partial [Myxococcota bacterium]
DAVLQAVLTGLREGERRLAVSFGVIVTALRNLSPADSLRLAELAVAWSDRGVVGFDLAGPEEGNSSEPHRRAFETAAGGGLGVTIHAGEVSGPETVTHALDCGANRIGHGTQLRRDPAVLERVKSEQIPLESCPTSNVQTHAVTGYDDHPLMDYHRQGLPVTVNTDSRLVSLTSVTDEMMHLHEHQGMTWDEAIELCKASFRAAFLDAARKEELVGRVDTVVEKAIAAGFNPATLTVETSAD